MTCIIGLEHEGKVYIGGDAAGADGWTQRSYANPKVFRLGDLLIGYSSSFRMGQLLQHSLIVPQHSESDTDERYLVGMLIPAIRDTLKTGGFARVDSNVESGGFFLVGYHSKLYEVQQDFSILASQEHIESVGSGYCVALGAMLALEYLAPKERILKALEIVGRCADGVLPPFVVIEL